MLAGQHSAKSDIVLRNVSYTYGGKKDALRDISCTIPGGKTTVLWGPPGSGKSTLAKIVLGLYLPDSGTVRFKNAGEQCSAEECRKRIAFLLDEPTSALNAELSKELLEQLQRCFPDTKKIIITHDPSLLAYADTIIQLKSGRIVANHN